MRDAFEFNWCCRIAARNSIIKKRMFQGVVKYKRATAFVAVALS
jgi:hypothetical protein